MYYHCVIKTRFSRNYNIVKPSMNAVFCINKDSFLFPGELSFAVKEYNPTLVQ